MVEFGIRLLIAGALLFVAGAFGLFGFDLAWKAAAAIAATAVFGWQLEVKGMKNSGVAGFFAIADAFTIALVFGSMGLLDTLGFLVLAPCAYAAAKHRATPSAMAPLAASALLVAHSVFHQGSIPSGMLLFQALGVLATGLLISQTQILVARPQPGAQEVLQLPPVDEDGLLQLRESYRSLRDAYRDLERKSRRDRLVVQLDEARSTGAEKPYTRLCSKLKEMTGADDVALYSLAQFADSMVVRATTPEYPRDLKEAAFEVNLDRAPGQVKHALEKAIHAIGADAGNRRFANVLLNDRGHVVGMLCVTHSDADRLEEARERATEIAPYLASLIATESRREAEQRRLRETELLYEIAGVSVGATNDSALAARVVRELWEMLSVDHVGVFLLDGNDAILASHAGVNVRLVEELSLEGGKGIAGWIRSGAPEVVLFDARDDGRCPADQALKRRVGSFVLLPLQADLEPTGFLTVATHSRGGIDLPELETLRVVAAELGLALTRAHQHTPLAEGVMTPKEFAERVSGASGCFVYLEPLKKEQLTDSFGKPALSIALRKFIARLRRKLPSGGCICRRDEGDYIVYLPIREREAAVSWANDVTASAAMVGVRTPDGSARIPLALRAKVATLDKQENQFVDEMIV